MLQSLQACRAFAAILVVLYHTSHGIFHLPKYFGNKPFGLIFDFGFAGVDFFFVLSGFIMMHVHATDIGRPSALGGYLWKRFSRIYPAYWAILLAILPIYFFVPSDGKGFETDPDVIWRAFLLFPHPEAHQVLGVAWTLVYEIFFYLLFGVMLLNRRLGLIVFVAWTVGIFVLPGGDTFPLSFLFSEMHLRFLAGIAVALIVRRCEIPCPRVLALAGALVFLGTGIVHAYAGPVSSDILAMGFTLGSATLLLGVIQAERSGLLHTPRFLVYLGDASYAIYLVHFLGLSILAKVAKGFHLDAMMPTSVLFALHVAGAIGIGCLFHQVIEKPLHSLTRSFIRRERIAVVSQDQSKSGTSLRAAA